MGLEMEAEVKWKWEYGENVQERKHLLPIHPSNVGNQEETLTYQVKSGIEAELSDMSIRFLTMASAY